MRKYVKLVICSILLIGGYLIVSNLGSEQILLKTWDKPNGGVYNVVSDDNTEVVQFWHHTKGNYHVLHKSGNVTYVNSDKFRGLVK